MSGINGDFPRKRNPSQEIALTNRVLNFILQRGWIDYDNFSTKIAKRIVSAKPGSAAEVLKIVDSFPSSFFELNHVARARFIDNFPVSEVVDVLGEFQESQPLTFLDVFPETAGVTVDEGKNLISRLNIDESIIQGAIRDSLRERNATNPIERGHDSALEVAEPEHFWLRVNGVFWTFAGIVKGYNSLSGKTVKLKTIANQVIRAYNRTRPDYVLLVLAKNPSDSIISELVEFGKSVGKPHLLILCDPVSLARFLRARGLI